eukprot:107090-Lingulodinium_polyedra.AAC.1
MPLGAKVTKGNTHDLVQRLRKDVADCLWHKAAAGRWGAGIQGMPDLAAVIKLKKEFAKKESYQELGILKRVIAAGLWPDG